MIKNVFFLLSLLAIIGCKPNTSVADEQKANVKAEYAMVIHGGAGVIKKENFTPEKLAAYKAALNTALDTGDKILANGQSSYGKVESCYAFGQRSR